MKEIPLTLGKVAIVDDADYESLSKWNWHATECGPRVAVYARRSLKRSPFCVLMHRVILNAPDGTDVDHINGDGLDNRRKNLRLATRSENLRNSKSRRGSTSQYKGVSLVSSRNNWLAQITINGKHYNLGRYKTEANAAIAYNIVALQHFGEFAKLNL